VLSVVTRHTAMKGGQRQVRHDLRENVGTLLRQTNT
jgi:hypothetical protein